MYTITTASQKFGMPSPRLAATCAMRSKTPPRIAASMPMVRPTVTASNVASSASDSVAGTAVWSAPVTGS